MYIGIDIGGTTTKYGIVRKDGTIFEKGKIQTAHEKSEFLQNLFGVISDLQQRAGTIEGIGISAPGIIQKDGTLTTAGSIKSLYGTNLREELEKHVQLPVVIENDANAAAIAEKWIGHARDFEHYICLVLGTGIGGGIIINNQVYRGGHGMAGEFGWMLMDQLPDSGNVESVSLNQRAAIVGGLCYQYLLATAHLEQNKAIHDAIDIFKLEEQGDEIAAHVIQRFFQDLSVGLLNLISSFDPEAILIGGAISENEGFMARLQQTLADLKSRHESIAFLQHQKVAPVITAKLKNDAGMIGAVYQVIKYIEQKKVSS